MKAIYFFLMIGIVACNQTSTNNIDKIQKDHTKIEKPVCSENETKDPNQPEDPIIVRTCIWKGYKFMRTGSADNMRRYSWDYEVYRVMEDKIEISTKNSAVFSINQVELENLINKKVGEELAELKKDEDEVNLECLSNFQLPIFKLDDMQVSFDGDQSIVFEVGLGLGSACRPVDVIYVKIPITRVEIYLK
jgi:hypothetical protein